MLELNNRPVAHVDSNAWKMMDTSYIYKCVYPSVMIILSNWSLQVSLLSLNNNLLEIYFPIVCVGYWEVNLQETPAPLILSFLSR